MQLADLHGRPLLERVLADIAGWPVESAVVVLGHSSERILAEVDFGDAVVAVNEGWEEGRSSSLRVGLDVLTRDAGWERTFVALGDQPGIPPEVPHRLLSIALECEEPAIVPVYRYEQGNPVLFDRSLWHRLMALSGDGGAAALLRTHPEWVKEVRFDEVRPTAVSTTDDLMEQMRRRPPGSPDR